MDLRCLRDTLRVKTDYVKVYVNSTEGIKSMHFCAEARRWLNLVLEGFVPPATLGT